MSEHKGARERVSMPAKNSPRRGEPGNEADSQGKRGVPNPGAQLVLGGEGMHVGEKTEFMMLQWAVITKQSTVLLAPLTEAPVSGLQGWSRRNWSLPDSPCAHRHHV